MTRATVAELRGATALVDAWLETGVTAVPATPSGDAPTLMELGPSVRATAAELGTHTPVVAEVLRTLDARLEVRGFAVSNRTVRRRGGDAVRGRFVDGLRLIEPLAPTRSF